MAAEAKSPDEFNLYHDLRRELLWSLLGDLPETTPPKATLKKVEQHPGFTLEHLDLELNGMQTVPALLLIPEKRAEKAPGLMYHHWHGGDYFVGKQELLTGTRAMQAYAPVYAEKGIVALAIDSWCFGERARYLQGDAVEGARPLRHDAIRRVAGPELSVHTPGGGRVAHWVLRHLHGLNEVLVAGRAGRADYVLHGSLLPDGFRGADRE